MRKFRNYNEENMGIEEEFLRRWKKHKNIVVGKDKDNLEWYDEAIKDLEPYLEEPNIITVAFDWKKLEFSFKYCLENPITTRKEYVMGEICDITNKYDEAANNEVEKFFDEYRPLVGLGTEKEVAEDYPENWFEGSKKVLTFHFKDEVKGLKTWLKAVKVKRDKYLEKFVIQSEPQLVDIAIQTDLTAKQISQMEAQIEVLSKHN